MEKLDGTNLLNKTLKQVKILSKGSQRGRTTREIILLKETTHLQAKKIIKEEKVKFPLVTHLPQPSWLSLKTNKEPKTSLPTKTKVVSKIKEDKTMLDKEKEEKSVDLSQEVHRTQVNKGPQRSKQAKTNLNQSLTKLDLLKDRITNPPNKATPPPLQQLNNQTKTKLKVEMPKTKETKTNPTNQASPRRTGTRRTKTPKPKFASV